MSNEPFFIVGCPRSGTTLLQTLLDRQPRITLPPESHLFDNYVNLFSSFGDLTEDKNMLKLLQELFQDEWIRRWGLLIQPAALMAQVQTRSVRGVIEALFKAYQEQRQKMRWGDKTPDHGLWLDSIHQVFPDAKYIHLIRDGRDVAESLSRMYFGPRTVDKIAQLWKRYLVAFEDFRKKLPASQCLAIYYEDLVDDPGVMLKKICEFLGEDYQRVEELKATELYAVYLKDFGRIHSTLNLPVTPDRVGRYKHRLSPREIEIFESIAGEALTEHGYERQVKMPRPVGKLENIKLFITNLVVSSLAKMSRLSHVKERVHSKWRKLVRGGRKTR